MRINDIITENKKIDEIERISPSGFEGGKKYLDTYGREKTVRKLPGGSGLLYSITKDGRDAFIIKIWDPVNKGEYQEPPMNAERPPFYTRREWESRLEILKKRAAITKQKYEESPGKLIGQLSVYSAEAFPIKGAVKVGTITVDEDYRGIGLAKALYGIVLTIMKRPLLAGSSQTPGGRRNWMSLSQIPGVEMKGYFRIDDDDFDYHGGNKKIDVIMGKLGGQYIGKNSYNGNHYFAFDVLPNTTAKELKAHVDTNLSKVYGGYNSTTGLYAVWTGQ